MWLCEIQTAVFRAWTRIAESSSYDDNYYNSSASWLFGFMAYQLLMVI